jgi:DMSO/TMAO reductase YedYZ heme-binding membrane subunit
LATTRSRPHGREHARPSSGGVASEHAAKIYAVALSGIVVIVAFLALTSTGHVIDAATQHFMLFYAGVFALIALCASVGLGLVATDRLFLSPGHRVFVQSAHRAASFGAVTFLVIHIVTEILAQRVHALDAVIPFLSPFRTFYIGLGTIASDLIILLVITGIMRGRFNASGKAWRWRAIHYVSYLSFVLGVWHGLLGGRPGKPYVDWSYGFVVAFVAVGLAVRILSGSLRPKENLSGPPVPMTAHSASAPMRAAAMFAQLGVSRGAGQSRTVLTATAEPMLSAPVAMARHAAPVLTAPLPAGRVLAGGELRSPTYEPGYEGPVRYLGAPRDLGTTPGPVLVTGSSPADGPGFWPQDENGALSDWGSGHAGSQPHRSADALSASGPFPRADSGPLPRAMTGPIPRVATGPFPQVDSGPLPRAATGPMPRSVTGPIPRVATGPFPRADSGPLPRAASGPMPRAMTGPIPRVATGPFPQVDSGPLPRAATGPMPRAMTGPMPRAATGPLPRADSGPFPRAATGGQPRLSGDPYPYPYPGTGPLPRVATGPLSRADSGPFPRADSGSFPRVATGPLPQADSGPFPRAESGPFPQAATGGQPRLSGDPYPYPYPGTSPLPRAAAGPLPRAGSGPLPPADGRIFPAEYGGTDGSGGPGRHSRPLGQAPWDGGFPEPDPAFRYREPGPGMPGYRGSREHRYGGDVRL